MPSDCQKVSTFPSRRCSTPKFGFSLERDQSACEEDGKGKREEKRREEKRREEKRREEKRREEKKRYMLA